GDALDITHHRPTVLVVDDDPLLLQMLTCLLTGEGFHVLPAADGREGLQAFRQGRAIDLILADVYMPGMDGLQMVSALRQSGLRPLTGSRPAERGTGLGGTRTHTYRGTGDFESPASAIPPPGRSNPAGRISSHQCKAPAPRVNARPRATPTSASAGPLNPSLA